MSEDNIQNESTIKGVFSREKMAKIGTGTTARRVQQTTYYYVEEVSPGLLEVQTLSTEMVPYGSKQKVSKEKFLADYMPEPQIYQQQVYPKIRDIQKSIARGDKFRARGETFTAEFEYGKALTIDENNVRANFGIGLCYMERGDKEKADQVFSRLVELEAAFDEEHKHLFNSFGINMRKTEMYDQAIAFYKRALKLSGHDENIYYNLARCFFDKQDFDMAKKCLVRCLKINPKHTEAHKFVMYLKKKLTKTNGTKSTPDTPTE
ncbi:MAG: tetratricopeptide repeat protein [Desulfovibrio sp.]